MFIALKYAHRLYETNGNLYRWNIRDETEEPIQLFKDHYYQWWRLIAQTNDYDVLFFKDKNENNLFGAIKNDGSQVIAMINNPDYLYEAVLNGDTIQTLYKS